MPQFKYILAKTDQLLSPRSRIWNLPLPADRSSIAGDSRDGTVDCAVSYKTYFEAARCFLERNKFEVLTRAAGRRLKRTIQPEEIVEIRICLEKHGQFYHPARVEVRARQFDMGFVLNVALSITGKNWLETEYETLRRLKRDFPRGYLPAVYGCGEVKLSRPRCRIPMFLGEWFEGFNEFHLSRDPHTGQHRILVWDYHRGDYYLTRHQAVKLFTQAAKVLTRYYNPDTFEQIFSWHHAAGDFVLNRDGTRMRVRLISARQYRKLFEVPEGAESDAALVLKALLIFFLQLSIRMRLDRLDGTGPVAWIGREALTGTLKGFFEALERKPMPQMPEASLSDGFQAYLKMFPEEDLLGLLKDISVAYAPGSPDLPTVTAHLAEHAAELYGLIHGAGR